MRKLILYCSISLVVMLCIVNFTNPTDAGPLGVLALFFSIYTFGMFLALFFFSLFRKMNQEKENTKKKDFFYSVIIGFGPIILLLVRTFGMLNIWSIIFAFVFVLFGCFLIKKRFSVVK